MKKKSLRSLKLQKHKISNLTIISKKIGGYNTSDTDTDVETNPSIVSFQIACVTIYDETCAQTVCVEGCGTNGGTVKSPPPTEYNTCHNCYNPSLDNY